MDDETSTPETPAPVEADPTATTDTTPGTPGSAAKKRRRGSRGGKNRKKPTGARLDGEAVDDDADDAADDGDDQPAPVKPARSSERGGPKSAEGRSSNGVELPDRAEEAQLA